MYTYIYLNIAEPSFYLFVLNIDRYRIVVNPMKPRISLKVCMFWLFIIWFVSGIISLPSLIYATHVTYTYEEGTIRQACFLYWPDGHPGRSQFDFV